MYKILSPMAVLVIWEVLARYGLINTLILPPPSKIFAHFGEMILSMEILVHTGSSLGRVAFGFALAVLTAIRSAF
jgi:NitT/TauT family transport system permease protein